MKVGTNAGMDVETKKILEAVFSWLEIRVKSGQVGLSRLSAETLMEDALKSALLPRLLEGEKALPEPPPTSFGQPWHEIVEDGRARAAVEEIPEMLRESYPVHVLVNGFPWSVLERDEEGSYVVSWKAGGELYWLARIKGDTSDRPWALMKVLRG